MKLFSQLYVANKRKNCDIGNFFSTKNTSVPPSLSKVGKVQSGDKTDLLDSLYDGCNTQDTKSTVDGIVFEGNMYRPTGQITFKEYFEERLEPSLQEKLVHVNRLDVVWDIYLEK